MVADVVAVFFSVQIYPISGHASSCEECSPYVSTLLVTGYSMLGVAGEHTDIYPIGIETNDLCEKMSEQGDLFSLEVVAKTPVSEHLEESCMAIVADLFDIL
ncbi:MAG: hypothetical protein K0Q61_1381 [Rhodococcus erythropolis]|nr:hypothetical protein [Rhodococcus erythropolis]